MYRRDIQTRVDRAGAQRSRRFNILIEQCVQSTSKPSGKTMVKRAQARAPGAFQLHGYGLVPVKNHGPVALIHRNHGLKSRRRQARDLADKSPRAAWA